MEKCKVHPQFSLKQDLVGILNFNIRRVRKELKNIHDCLLQIEKHLLSFCLCQEHARDYSVHVCFTVRQYKGSRTYMLD